MKKRGLITNYKLIYKKSNRAHNQPIVAEIKPNTSSERELLPDVEVMYIYFNTSSQLYKYDKNIPDNNNLMIEIDDEKDYTETDGNGNPTIHSIQNHLEPKEIEPGDVEVSENSDTLAVLNNSQVKSDFSVIRSNDNQTHITVSDNSVDIRSDESGINLGPEGMTLSGKISILDIPSEDHLLFKESGMARLLPKGFPIPFSSPDYRLNVDFISNIYATTKNFNKMAKALKVLDTII